MLEFDMEELDSFWNSNMAPSIEGALTSVANGTSSVQEAKERVRGDYYRQIATLALAEE